MTRHLGLRNEHDRDVRRATRSVAPKAWASSVRIELVSEDDPSRRIAHSLAGMIGVTGADASSGAADAASVRSVAACEATG